MCKQPIAPSRTYCNTLQHTTSHTLQHIATHCNTLQCTAMHCSTLQHTATHCNALQRTATHCNTRQYVCTCERRHILHTSFPATLADFSSMLSALHRASCLACVAVCCSVLQMCGSVLQIVHPASTDLFTCRQQCAASNRRVHDSEKGDRMLCLNFCFVCWDMFTCRQ